MGTTFPVITAGFIVKWNSWLNLTRLNVKEKMDYWLIMKNKLCIDGFENLRLKEKCVRGVLISFLRFRIRAYMMHF